MGDSKRFFSKHSKSSAAVVSLAVHAILVLVALSYVAVSVVKSDKVAFKAESFSRPKMHLRKLHVPVNMKKSVRKPTLRKQIIAKPKVANVMESVKMPEIVGVKGSLGAGGGSAAGAISFGFSLPELNFFGVKSKGEKVVIILDANRYMSSDALGGVKGFEVIKKECLRLIDGLPPTAVFNIIVYGTTRELFPELVPASADNVRKAKDWLLPLNQNTGAKTQYGVDTLGPGGSQPAGHYPFGVFKDDCYYPKKWNEPVMLAMKQQADTVFLLTGDWGNFGFDQGNYSEFRRKWNQTSAGKRWEEKVLKARKLLDEDNARRKAAGKAPNSLNRNDERLVVRAYLPGTPEPPYGKRVYLKAEDLIKTLREAYKAYSLDDKNHLTALQSKRRFALNVIFFKKSKFKDAKAQQVSDRDEGWFRKLADSLGGEFRSIEGLNAIQSYVKVSSTNNSR